MKKIGFLILLLAGFQLHSQDIYQNYKPLDTLDQAKRNELAELFKLRFKAQQDELKREQISGKLKKRMLASYKSSHEEILREVKEGQYYIENQYTKYCDKLLDEIRAKSPSISKNIKVLLSKSPVLNAYDIGSDILIINMGAISFLDNEEQLKSILSHELGHNALGHVRSNIKGIAERSISKELKKEVRGLGKYNKSGKGLSLQRKRIYQNSKMRRRHELAADSLGFVLFDRVTEYPQESFFALKKIKERSEEKEEEEEELAQELEITKETYKKYFTLPARSFKGKWMVLEDFSAYEYGNYKEKFDEDSISSHPDHAVRMDRLKKMIGAGFDEKMERKKPSQEFEKLQEAALFQHVADLYSLKRYGYSVFFILHFLQKYPDNIYLKKYLGYNFTALYEAKKKYEFSRHVSSLKPNKQSDNVVQFLNFLWNLDLEDYYEIGRYYGK